MSGNPQDFFDLYLEYTAKTESPKFFHRWAIISCLGAQLGRQCYLEHGFFTLYPNLYTMLVGSPGTKKSSSIKIAAALLKKAGYNTFGAKKTRQEKFLMDLAESTQQEAKGDGFDILEENLFGDTSVDENLITECFVAADEFNNFIGVGNLEFMSILGELWDYTGVYDYKLKNSQSMHIPNPTISILGGNTPTGMASAFPTEALGQGFFSRLILVFAEESGVKYTFPPPPDKDIEAELIKYLKEIKIQVRGPMAITKGAEDLLDKIYHQWVGIPDSRFEHYTNRRLPHLLKLCVVFAAAALTTTITEAIVIYANTILTYTEHTMPKALGEFGKARHSDVTHRIMTVLDGTSKVLTVRDLWKHVAHDLERREQLFEILGNLCESGKIQAVHGVAGSPSGYLPVKQLIAKEQIGVDFSLLGELT